MSTAALGLSVGFLLLALSTFGCDETGAQAARTDDVAPELRVDAALLKSGQMQIEPVSARTEGVSVRTSGRVGFNEQRLSYVSSPLTGRVVDVVAQPGAHVAAGAVLAVVDSPELGTAWSELIKARADLTLAERSYKLAQELLTAKAIARKDFQKAEDEDVKAHADLRRARERLISLGATEAEVDAPLDELHVRSRLNLTAPIAGTVVERALTLGQMVGADPAPRLFVIADLDTLWVTADVYEKDLPLVHVGQEVAVTAAAWPDDTFHGRIQYVGDTVDPSTRTVKVRLAVDNPALRLKPEMFVTANISTEGTAAVLSVPLAAIHGEGLGQPYVFVVGPDDQVAPRAISLGDKFDERAVVRTGLAAGDRVITQGSILLNAQAARQVAG